MNDLQNMIQDTQNLNLLYVEDNKEIRESTTTLLEIFFKSITEAVDGIDGLNKFQSNTIDIVITDINMPNMDGLAMFSEIKNINPQMPILVLSAHNEAELLLAAIKLSVDGYLLKPINIEQFATVLHKIVENINLKKENLRYKLSLEEKVNEQIKELILKDKLITQQSKMAAMGEIIDAVAHQWKQPLNIIGMKTDILDLYRNEAMMVEYKYVDECRNDIKLQINHLVDTLDEFRNFLRPNHDLKTIHLQSLLNSIKTLLKDELIRNTINLKIECAHHLSIVANENDIKHLFINLIKNSMDEMENSKIEYNQRVIHIECHSINDTVTLKVSDSGKGIPNEIIENIFTIHFTTKEKSGGTGIGLYMCKQIVQKYNGTLVAYNSQNSGAVFEVSFNHADTMQHLE